MFRCFFFFLWVTFYFICNIETISLTLIEVFFKTLNQWIHQITATILKIVSADLKGNLKFLLHFCSWLKNIGSTYYGMSPVWCGSEQKENSPASVELRWLELTELKSFCHWNVRKMVWSYLHLVSIFIHSFLLINMISCWVTYSLVQSFYYFNLG